MGLAEALGVTPVIKRINLRRLWRHCSPYLLWGKKAAISPRGDALQPPWPDMVIASGRQSVLPALYVKEASGQKTFLVQIQNPAIPTHHFDLVIVPEHDRMEGAHVVTSLGALHRVEKNKLADAAQKWAPHFSHLPKPLVAVLLGGSNGSYKLTPREIMQLGPQLSALAKKEKGGLVITPSRRTDAACVALLSALLHDVPHYLWNGTGDNPYYGMLALADAFIVTCDSVNMISECCATGKPVHVVALPGHSDKFAAFHKSLLHSGRIRMFTGELQRWTYPPLDEMTRLAGIIRAKYAEKHG